MEEEEYDGKTLEQQLSEDLDGKFPAELLVYPYRAASSAVS